MIRNALAVYKKEIMKSPQEAAILKDCIENIHRCISVNDYNGYVELFCCEVDSQESKVPFWICEPCQSTSSFNSIFLPIFRRFVS